MDNSMSNIRMPLLNVAQVKKCEISFLSNYMALMSGNKLLVRHTVAYKQAHAEHKGTWRRLEHEIKP